MANSLTAYAPTIIGKTIPILRETLAIQKYVTRDYDSDFANIGSTLQIPVTAQLQTQDESPSSVAKPLVSITPSSVTLTLNKWKTTPFTLTTADLNLMMKNTDFMPSEMEEAFRSTARQVVTDIWAVTTQCPYYVGTAGTNPFATSLTTLNNARKSLNITLADKNGRVMLIDNSSDANALNLSALTQNAQRASSGYVPTLATGEIGEISGFQLYRDSMVPTWTAGTGASYTMPVAPPALGATSAAIITGTGTINAGDIFTVAGNTQTYVATNSLTAAGTLTWYPPLAAVPGASAAITLAATHVNNFGMDRGFMALAMRQPRETEDMINEVIPIIDNQGPEATNMQFYISKTPNRFATTYDVGCLYGVTMLRPERGVRMAG